jgi:hypothetical protein
MGLTDTHISVWTSCKGFVYCRVELVKESFVAFLN